MSLDLPVWAIASPGRQAHIGRVVALAERWANQLGVGAAETARWRRAALLHDALKDATAEQLASYTPRGDWPEALWHGPAAAVAAERHGEQDRGVLDAVRYHSVGLARWDDVGKAVYLADYLEEGRGHARERRAALAARMPGDMAQVLIDVTADRLGWLVTRRKQIRQESWEFWNRIVADASSS